MGADPQLEDGYTRIANELLEAFARVRFAGQERQVIDVVLRKTYGYGKRSDEISYGQFSNLTGIPRTKIIPLVKGLVLKMVLGSTNNGTRKPPTIWINKHYGQWLPSPKKGTSPNNRTTSSPNNGVVDSPNNGTHKRNKRKKEIPTTFFSFSKGFLEHQQKSFPNIIKTISQADIERGAITIEELVRIDGFDFEKDIRPAVNWAARDTEFWKANILSLAGLRKKKDGLSKFQKIQIAFLKSKNNGRTIGENEDEYAGTIYANLPRY